ncbi:MAG: hypothetical protein JWM43_3140 [Acidobacteriaceae bacterium]|nr:hypothetical protein [Acidobacteriaceae bacterium]
MVDSSRRTASNKRWRKFVNGVFVLWMLSIWSSLPTQAQAPPRQVIRGTIVSITDGVLTVKSDGGSSVQVQLSPDAQIKKLPVGSTDFTNAASASASELDKGDRVLISAATADSGPATAKVLYVIKASDIGQKQTAEQADWQKRGIGGVVRSIDPAAKIVTISLASAAGIKNVAIKVTSDTALMRYATDSVKFADAKAASLEMIQVGDQLTARGNLSTDGTTMAAEELVTGSFRSFSAQIAKIDAAGSTLTVKDLATKATVAVTVTNNTEMHMLTPQVAASFAARAKSSAPNLRQNDSSDLMQVINNMPTVTLAQLKPGDALMIAATVSQTPNSMTAITLLSGVEPILRASPSDASMALTPWNLSSGNGN